MDEKQIDELGSKMRDTYADVASEAPAPAQFASKHPSRRLRKNSNFARVTERKSRAASTPGGVAGGFVTQHPTASLVIAAGVGYLFARISAR